MRLAQSSLRGLFESKPEMPPTCIALKEWQKLGPFDYVEAIKEHKLTFDVTM